MTCVVILLLHAGHKFLSLSLGLNRLKMRYKAGFLKLTLSLTAGFKYLVGFVHQLPFVVSALSPKKAPAEPVISYIYYNASLMIL